MGTNGYKTTALAHASNLADMRLLKYRTGKSINPPLSSRLRLNKVVLLVTFLWVLTSLLLLFYHAGSAHAVQPRKVVHPQMASAQAAARASFI
ncbi:MAG TPA: hypothetical protein VHA06_01485 [Candidatus Angelobacter sp.]|jgi:hypothetical protein|nr:hypothetical protein [Candidatus Angelobacter sp.]